MSPKYVIFFTNTFGIQLDSLFITFPCCSSLCAPHICFFFCPLIIMLYPCSSPPVPTTSIHPRSALLLPVCPSPSLPHSLQLTSASTSRLYVCRHPSINTFNPCFLQLLVLPRPIPPSLSASTISGFSLEDKKVYEYLMSDV